MERTSDGQSQTLRAEEDVSLGVLAALILQWRRLIFLLGCLGAASVLTYSLLSDRLYESSASFIPQGSESATAGLSLAAGQFGLRLASPTGVWGPGVYVHLLKTHALLAPIALDTLTISGEGKAVSVMDLLRVPAYPEAKRIDETLIRLRALIDVSEVRSINAVKISVRTRWPLLSHRIAQHLVDGANRFNLETRKTTATVERQFVERQAAEASQALAVAERALEAFLIRNRSVTNSPELAFERDRLLRDVALRQSVYSGLLSSREEARIREFRDTPVISVIEVPRLPSSALARKSIQKGIVGGIAGVAVGILIALLGQWLDMLRRVPNPAVQEAVRVLSRLAPKRSLRDKRV